MGLRAGGGGAGTRETRSPSHPIDVRWKVAIYQGCGGRRARASQGRLTSTEKMWNGLGIFKTKKKEKQLTPFQRLRAKMGKVGPGGCWPGAALSSTVVAGPGWHSPPGSREPFRLEDTLSGSPPRASWWGKGPTWPTQHSPSSPVTAGGTQSPEAT